MSTGASHAYHGPADLWLTYGAGSDQLRQEGRSGVRVLLEQTMPGLYLLRGDIGDGLAFLRRVLVTLPDGQVLGGAVTSAAEGRVMFRVEPA